MNSPNAFYKESLYPLQDGILRLVRELGTPLYLTGGTALSRGYFGHRYSDDLDLFTNADSSFTRWVDLVVAGIESAHRDGALLFHRAATLRASEFTRLSVSSVTSPGIELKVDFANDSAPHFGEFVTDPALGRVDSLRNILSNKLAATLRFAGKDMADLWVICRNRAFDWRSIWSEAQEKEAGLDPATVAEVVSGVPLSELESVRWRDSRMDCRAVRDELEVVARDIVRGAANSLGTGNPPLER